MNTIHEDLLSAMLGNLLAAHPELAQEVDRMTANLPDPEKGRVMQSLLRYPVGVDLADIAQFLIESNAPANGNGHQSSSWADLKASIGPVEFDWQQWLPKGLLTILVSKSGDGKSLLALRLCGCYLLGLDWPDGTAFTVATGSVLWVEAEAAQAVNLGRAERWGYPLEKILTPFNDPTADANLDNRSHREIIAERARLPEVRLVVIDSLSGSSSRVENSTDIKEITLWAAKVGRDTNKPVLLLHHLNKRRKFDGEQITLDRVRGSSAIVQFGRVVWALSTPDAKQLEYRQLEQIKNNLARFPAPIGMTAAEGGIEFGVAVPVAQPPSVLERAMQLLDSLLANGPVQSTEIKQAFARVGISWRTANEAKKRLHLEAERQGDAWYWKFPEAEPTDLNGS